jgi:membrane protease YdiL (CAAX protease family)
MSTTSSPTSSAPSSRSRRVAAVAAWGALALGQIALAYVATFALEDADEDSEIFYEYGTAVGGVAWYAFIAGLAFVIARLFPDLFDALGLRRFAGRWVAIAIGVVVAVAVLTFALAALGANAGEEQGYLPDTWRPERAGAIAANAFVAVLVAPLVEELFYRGLGVSALSLFGSWAAIVVSGLAFGLAHGLVLGLAPLVLFGVGLAWVRLRSGSIWPGFVAHALYNGSVLALGLLCLSDPKCRAELAGIF